MTSRIDGPLKGVWHASQAKGYHIELKVPQCVWNVVLYSSTGTKRI